MINDSMVREICNLILSKMGIDIPARDGAEGDDRA